MAPVIRKDIPRQVKIGAYFSKAVPGEPLVRASQRPGLPRRGGRDGGGEGGGRRLLGRPDPGFSRAQREEKGYDEDDGMVTLGSSDSEDDDEEGGAWTQLGPREELTPPPGEGRDVEEDEAIEAVSPSPAKRRRLVSRAQLPSSESTSTSEVGDIVPAKRHHTRSQAHKKWERRNIKAASKTLDISIPLGAEWPRDTEEEEEEKEEEEEEEKSDEKSDDEVKEKIAAPSAATTIDTRTTRSSAPLTSASSRARIIRSRRITTSAIADGSRSTRSTRQATKDVSSSPPPKRSARRTALRTPCRRGPVSSEEEESDGTPDPLRMSSLTPPSKKARIATNHFAVAAEDSDSSDMLEIGVCVGSSSAAKTARSSARNMASCSTSKMRKSKDHASQTRQEQSVSPLPVRCQVRKTHGWKQVIDSDEEMAKDEIEKKVDEDDDDDELVMAPQRRRLRRIPDPDDKEEGNDDDADDPPRQSQVLNNNKKQRGETKNEEKDEEEEPDDLEDDQGRLYTLDTRMRGAYQRIGKAAAGRKNMLAILKKKREGRSSPTFHVIDSEADEEDMENDDENLSRASEDDNDEEDAMIVDDDDDEEDEFIVEDYQTDRFQLPSQFQQVRPMRSNFDIAVQYHIHLIVFGPSFALQHGKAPYFSAALNRIRDQIIDVRNSKITSQVWPTHFKVALERYPIWDGYRIEDLPPCDACRISGRPATWEVVLSGDPYDRKTFQVIVPSNDGEGSEGADAKFNCGRFCYARAEFQHQMNHWEYDLHESLRREISKLPSTADKQSYSDAGREFMLEGGIEVPARDECTEEAVDQILAYFQLKGISDREWRKVKRLLEEGDSLNSQWSRRQGDD